MNKICWSGAALLAAFTMLAAPLDAGAQGNIRVIGGTGGTGGTLGDVSGRKVERNGTSGKDCASIPSQECRIIPVGAAHGGSTRVGNTGGTGQGLEWAVTGTDLNNSTLTIAGGTGGQAGLGLTGNRAGGNGGQGGNISMTIDSACRAGGAWSISGGAGGTGARSYGSKALVTNGIGGTGGDVALTVNGEIDYAGNDLKISGGNGGASGSIDNNENVISCSGQGGDGGNVSVDFRSSQNNIGKLTISGGKGGSLTNSTGFLPQANSSGNGGDVIVNFNQRLTISDKANFSGGTVNSRNPKVNYISGVKEGDGGDLAVSLKAGIRCESELLLQGGSIGRPIQVKVNESCKAGDLLFDASGQNITVLGKATITFDSWSNQNGGKVTVLSDTFTCGGDLVIKSGQSVGAEYLTFRTRELQFIGSSTFSVQETIGSDVDGTYADGKNGVRIEGLVIGGVNPETGASIASVALDNSKAVAGVGQGRYGFGGNLRVTGLGHSVANGGNLGQVSTLVCELTNDVRAGQTQLEVTEAPVLIANSQISIVNLGADLESNLNSGDRITLVSKVDNEETAIDDKIYQSSGLVTQYIMRIQHSGELGDSLDLVYLGMELAKGAEHSLAMGIGASNLLRLGGLDLIPSMIDTGHVLGKTNSGNQIEMLVGFSSAHEDFQLNSEIRSNRFNLAAGPALELSLVNGVAVIGAFFEAGWSDYAVSNQRADYAQTEPVVQSLDQAPSYNGHGKSHYLGGGALVGFKLDSGLHADASLAWGRLTNEFHPNWIKYADIDLRTTYLSAHLRAGYLIGITENQGLDIYGKLLWHHQSGRVAQLRNEQVVEFEPFSSMRGIVGVNYLVQASHQTSLSAGLAWEYQFKSEQEVFVDGLPVEPARFEGHTAQLNLGLRSQLAEHLSLGLDLQGSLGKRDGFGGNLTFAYSF